MNSTFRTTIHEHTYISNHRRFMHIKKLKLDVWALQLSIMHKSHKKCSRRISFPSFRYLSLFLFAASIKYKLQSRKCTPFHNQLDRLSIRPTRKTNKTTNNNFFKFKKKFSPHYLLLSIYLKWKQKKNHSHILHTAHFTVYDISREEQKTNRCAVSTWKRPTAEQIHFMHTTSSFATHTVSLSRLPYCLFLCIHSIPL